MAAVLLNQNRSEEQQSGLTDIKVIPVVEIQGDLIGEGKPGVIATRLRDIYI